MGAGVGTNLPTWGRHASHVVVGWPKGRLLAKAVHRRLLLLARLRLLQHAVCQEVQLPLGHWCCRGRRRWHCVCKSGSPFPTQRIHDMAISEQALGLWFCTGCRLQTHTSNQLWKHLMSCMSCDQLQSHTQRHPTWVVVKAQQVDLLRCCRCRSRRCRRTSLGRLLLGRRCRRCRLGRRCCLCVGRRAAVAWGRGQRCAGCTAAGRHVAHPAHRNRRHNRTHMSPSSPQPLNANNHYDNACTQSQLAAGLNRPLQPAARAQPQHHPRTPKDPPTCCRQSARPPAGRRR